MQNNKYLSLCSLISTYITLSTHGCRLSVLIRMYTELAMRKTKDTQMTIEDCDKNSKMCLSVHQCLSERTRVGFERMGL